MRLGERFLRWMGRQTRKPSGFWGKMMGHSMAWGHLAHTRWALSYLDVQPTDRILDIGCGSGMSIKLLAKMAAAGFAAGIDYSHEMVAQARWRNAAAIRAGRVEIVHGDVAALPYDDASFNKVIGVETFYFWPDPIQNLREVRRVLRDPQGENEPGGLLALAMEGSKECPHWTKLVEQVNQIGCPIYAGAEVVEMLTAAGFSRAWFEAAPRKGMGWLCALARK